MKWWGHRQADKKEPSRYYLNDKGARLGDLAQQHYERGEWQASIAKYQEAYKFYELAGNPERLAEIELYLGKVLIKSGNWSQGLSIFQKHKKYFQHKNICQFVEILNLIGYVYRKAGDYSLSLEYHHKALKICQCLENNFLYAGSLEKIAIISAHRGSFQIAEQQWKKVISVWEKLGALSQKSKTMLYLANFYRDFHKWYQAFDLYQQCISVKEKIEDPIGLSFVLDNLATWHYQKKEWDEAFELFEKSLMLKKEYTGSGHQAVTHFLLGFFYYIQQNFENAYEHYQISYRQNHIAGDLEGKIRVLEQQANIHVARRQWQKAQEKFEQSIQISEECENIFAKSSTQISYGKYLLRKNSFHKAREYFEKALEIWEKNKCVERAKILELLGQQFYRQQNWQQSWHYYHRALIIWQNSGNSYREARAIHYLGEILLSQDRYIEAMEYFSYSYHIYKTMNDDRGCFAAHLGIAATYLRLNRGDKALENYQKALDCCVKIGDGEGIAKICKKLGDLSLKENRQEECSRYYQRALAYYQLNNYAIAKEIENQLEELQEPT